MIEVIIPDQPNQAYPEAVLRSLVSEGKVQRNWKARAVGASSWSSVDALLNPTKFEDEKVAVPSLSSSSPRASTHSEGKNSGAPINYPFESRMMKRYAHGQGLVKGLEAVAESLETLGKLAVILLAVIGALLSGMMSNATGAFVVGGIIGLIFGGIVYMALKSLATMMRLQASLLAAAIDTAVYDCPYISDDARLALILPKED
jgi:hypothetical protein